MIRINIVVLSIGFYLITPLYADVVSEGRVNSVPTIPISAITEARLTYPLGNTTGIIDPKDGRSFISIEFEPVHTHEISIKTSDYILIDSKGEQYFPFWLQLFERGKGLPINAEKGGPVFSGSFTANEQGNSSNVIILSRKEKNDPFDLKISGKPKFILIFDIPEKLTGLKVCISNFKPIPIQIESK